MTDQESSTSTAPHCTDGNVLSRVGCILSYSGSVVGVSINYTLLVINLVWCIVALSLHTKDIGRSAALRTFALSALAFVFLFQILLCLAVHCTGVSILWCAMCGWIISERKRLKDTADVELSRWRAISYRMEQAVVVLDVAFIIYYAVENAAIVTVAHICAIILGATLSLLSIRSLDDDDGVTAQSTASSGPATTLIDKRDT